MDKAIVIKTDGSINIVDVPEDAGWEWMRSQINCEWIEFTHPRRLAEGYTMIVDEEGLLKDWELNVHGSWLYQTDIHGQPIAGDVLIMKEEYGDDGLECRGMTQDEADALVAILTEAVIVGNRRSV